MATVQLTTFTGGDYTIEVAEDYDVPTHNAEGWIVVKDAEGRCALVVHGKNVDAIRIKRDTAHAA